MNANDLNPPALNADGSLAEPLFRCVNATVATFSEGLDIDSYSDADPSVFADKTVAAQCAAWEADTRGRLGIPYSTSGAAQVAFVTVGQIWRTQGISDETATAASLLFSQILLPVLTAEYRASGEDGWDMQLSELVAAGAVQFKPVIQSLLAIFQENPTQFTDENLLTLGLAYAREGVAIDKGTGDIFPTDERTLDAAQLEGYQPFEAEVARLAPDYASSRQLRRILAKLQAEGKVQVISKDEAEGRTPPDSNAKRRLN